VRVFNDSNFTAQADNLVALSPWTALEICSDVTGVNDTWVCHAPESCNCEWDYTTSMLKLAPRGCSAMGSEARVALYAPTKLAPYVSLPATRGGTTGYYSGITVDGTSSWVETAVSGCEAVAHSVDCREID